MIVTNLLRRKLRTLFAFIGVAIAVAAIVSLTAITQGTIHQFEKIASDFRGDIMIQSAGAPDPIFSQIDPALVDEFSKLPEVSEAHPVSLYALRGLKNKDDRKALFVMTGLAENSSLLHRHKLIEGEYFTEGSKKILVGEKAAKDLNLSLGKAFKIQGIEFIVGGIFRTGVRLVDDGGLLSSTDIQSLRKINRISLIILNLHNGRKNVDAVIKKIHKKFKNLEAINSAHALDSFDQVETARKMAFGITLIALFVAAVGILNTMMMTVYERTKEIGLLRALGWSSRNVLSMILAEGLILSVTGGIFGFLLGVVGTEVLIETVDIGLIDAFYPPGLWLKTLFFSILIGFFGGLFPAWKATSIAPVEALRYE
ncbi:MAG: FtsX-like permease family protein [Bdellovibrionota bacterium]